MTSQRSTEFTTPTRDEIVAISSRHVALMESSDEDSAWIWAGMHHVLLRTIGRRSGREHKVALPFWRDPNGARIVVASFAGSARHPAWYLNLADRAANPDVFVRVQGGSYRSVPEILDGEEYDAVWAALLADRPHYADYQVRTTRRIPLVRLAETGRAEGAPPRGVEGVADEGGLEGHATAQGVADPHRAHPRGDGART